LGGVSPQTPQAFDLIFCNPPFVIGPVQAWMHTHGGRPVDQLCQDIIREAPALLREGGFCQVLCNWAHLAGQDWTARLQGWLADTGCDAWVVRFHTEDAPAYALNRIGELTDDPELSAQQFHDWMAYYEQQQIEAISFGMITMRRRSDGPNWFRCDSPSRPADLTGQAIQQQFALWDFLHSHADDNRLLGCRLRAADNLRWEVQHELSPDGWRAVESHLDRKDGLARGGNVDMEVVEFVAFCDGKKSLRDYLRQVSLRTGQEVSRLAPSFLKVVRRLVELGYLLPAEWGGDRPRG
jgi:hypothetical protein